MLEEPVLVTNGEYRPKTACLQHRRVFCGEPKSTQTTPAVCRVSRSGSERFGLHRKSRTLDGAKPFGTNKNNFVDPSEYAERPDEARVMTTVRLIIWRDVLTLSRAENLWHSSRPIVVLAEVPGETAAALEMLVAE